VKQSLESPGEPRSLFVGTERPRQSLNIDERHACDSATSPRGWRTGIHRESAVEAENPRRNKSPILSFGAILWLKLWEFVSMIYKCPAGF